MQHTENAPNLSFLSYFLNQPKNSCFKSRKNDFTQSIFSCSMSASSGNAITMRKTDSKLTIKTPIRSD